MAKFAHSGMMFMMQRKIPARFLQEYLETVAHAQSFQTSNRRAWALMHCFAELQYKLKGGAKCPQCRAHVRHVVPVTIERLDGSKDEFPCLCTRCFEGERANSRLSTMRIGDAKVEYKPRNYGSRTKQGATFPKKQVPIPTPPPV